MKKSSKMLLVLALSSLALTGCVKDATDTEIIEPVNTPVVEQPIVEETEKPILTGIKINDVHAEIKEVLGENYTPNMNLELDMLQSMTGVKSEDVKEFVAEMPMISAHVDTFIVVKAQEGKAESVEEALEHYRVNLIGESIQYPMNLAKVNASEVVRYGEDVYFIMLGAFDDREEQTEEEALEFAKEEVSKVKEIISKYYK